MTDTKLSQLIINECSEVPKTFEPNQIYLTPDTTDKDIAEALKQAKEYTDKQVGGVETSLNNYAKKSDLPAIPTKVSAFENDAGYLTKHQDVSGLATKDEVAGKQDKINDLDTIRSGASKGATAVQPSALDNYAKKTDIPAIPTKVSAFENDKGYLTQHQDISGLATKTELSGKQDTISDLDVIRSNASKGATALPSTTKYGADLSYSDNNLQLLDQDGNALGSSIKIEASGGGGSSNDLFDHKWSDHILDDMSWLRADTFSWQSGDVYKSAYEHLVEDFNGTTSATETIGSNTITYYQAEDKHKIVAPDQESVVQAIYEETGVAWYYILDTVNKRFKLPRTKWGFVGLRDNVGNYVPESLPDHLHNLSVNGTYDAVGSWYGTAGKADYAQAYTAKTELASATSPVYGGTEVQQRATQMYLYFYVGLFSKEATEQTAGITTEVLNDKLDIDLGNATTTTKETVVGWGMPSDNYVDLTLSSGSYTAPASGYIYAEMASATYIKIDVGGGGLTFNNNRSSAGALSVTAVVRKGQPYTIVGTQTTLRQHRFVYAEGEI